MQALNNVIHTRIHDPALPHIFISFIQNFVDLKHPEVVLNHVNNFM